MPRKMTRHAYDFLMDLSSRHGSAYESETMVFTQCRNVDFRGFTITYTWSDRNADTLYITEIYDRE